TTVPSCGFSFAVSGMTRPEAVVVSASLAWTRILSSSGLMFTLATLSPPLSGDNGRPGLLSRTIGSVTMPTPAHGPVVAGAGTCSVVELALAHTSHSATSTLYTRVPALKAGRCQFAG